VLEEVGGKKIAVVPLTVAKSSRPQLN
jgi:hypothetical protein